MLQLASCVSVRRDRLDAGSPQDAQFSLSPTASDAATGRRYSWRAESVGVRGFRGGRLRSDARSRAPNESALITAAARLPPRRLPANSHFHGPIATSRIWFSTQLLATGRSPVSMYRVSALPLAFQPPLPLRRPPLRLQPPHDPLHLPHLQIRRMHHQQVAAQLLDLLRGTALLESECLQLVEQEPRL
jgi:hypothetical protein